MSYVLLLLLLCSTVVGGTSSDEPPEEVFAFAGLSVVLPCLQTLPKHSDIPTIEWSKLGLSPPYVFVYRQNFEIYEDKHEDYRFRTHLFMTKVHHGNFSMRLSSVRPQDAGVYVCKTIWDQDHQDQKQVQLTVEDVPVPVLSVVRAEGGALNVSCVLHTCSPVVPRLTLLDGEGNVLQTEKFKDGGEDLGGCYTEEQRSRAQAGVKSVVCRVEFAEVDQRREAHMLIPELSGGSCVFTVVSAAAGGALLVGVLVGFVFLMHKVCSKGEKGRLTRESTAETSASSPSENQHLLIHIPEITEERATCLGAEPDLISSTNSSITSSASATRNTTNGSILALFSPEANANGICDRKTSVCEISDASKCVKYKKKEQRKTAKLTRQDAISRDSISDEQTPSSGNPNQANGISKPPARKCPLRRSWSASDSSLVPASLERFKRRYSVWGLNNFEKLTEVDAEQENLKPKSGNTEPN